MKWFRIFSLGVVLVLALGLNSSAQVVSANAPTSAPDDSWDARFYPPGPDNQVNALLVFNSELIAGGKLRTAGQDRANRVAKWNGTAWNALGVPPFQKLCPLFFGQNGCYLQVNALAEYQGKLYAGGKFTGVLGQWDGSQWSLFGDMYGPVEPGPCYGSVNALLASGSDLFVGGCFIHSGFSAFNQLLRWDGTTWSNLASAETVNVTALAMRGDDLYVAADEIGFNGIGANHIARWNRLTNTWSTLGGGLPTFVPTSLAFLGDTLLAGGSDKLYQWDGVQWSELASVSGANAQINILRSQGSDLYVGGSFTTIAGQAIRNLAIWNGATWRGFDDELNGAVASLLVDGTDLYVGGDFTLAGAKLAPFVARWNGTTWDTFLTPNAQGVVGAISTVVAHGTDIYIGGSFTGLGTQRANGLARWDTLAQSWTPLGDAACASADCIAHIQSITFDGSDMYVGGVFSQLDGVPANNLAKWNGSQWAALGSFNKGPVNAIAVKQGLVYVGGAFDSVQEWNGQTWRRIGRLYGNPNPHINALAFWNNALYAGGFFNRIGSLTVGNLARWDGSAWSAPPATGQVYAIVPSGNRVLLAEPTGIWRLQGGRLTQLGTGALTGYLNVAVGDNIVYRSGYAGLPLQLPGIELWDGVAWQPLGSAVSPGVWNFDTAVWSIAPLGKDVYIGGMFSIVGNKPSGNFARWTNPAPPAPLLLSPKNKQTVKSSTPNLKWAVSQGAASYQVQLYRTKRTGKLLMDTETGATQQHTPALNANKYFWHVRACNPTACSVWSDWWRFQVQ